MKILLKEKNSETIYYDITARIEKKKKLLVIQATLIEMNDLNSGSITYDLVILNNEDDLTENEKKELEELAINFGTKK
jgi:hypothetical protein